MITFYFKGVAILTLKYLHVSRTLIIITINCEHIIVFTLGIVVTLSPVICKLVKL